MGQNEDENGEHDWFDRQFEVSGEAPFTLHILTHGRRYQEVYESIEEALHAARAAWQEPRETPIAITDGTGSTRVDQEGLERLCSAEPS
jgi:hypothetical protein